jgi:glycine/D-amino acid oxidase-like deaminating enzyme
MRTPDQHEDENRSVWRAEAEAGTPTAPLAGSLTTDVAIIGGGFTGVSTALHLRRLRPELGIALFEAGALGQGASGRSGGQVLHWINGVSPETPEQLRRIYAVTGLGIDIAEQLAAQHAPASFRRSGALEVLTDARRAEEAHARAERWRAAGIPCEFVPASRLGIRGVHGAVLDPLAGRLNGFALLQALRPALAAQGIALYEGSRVLRVEGGKQVALTTARGAVRARALVLATDGYTPALGLFRRSVLPLHSHVLATAPLSDADWQRIGWGAWDAFSDDRDRIAYATRTPGGRLLLGGGGNSAYTYHYGSRVVASEAARAHAQTFIARLLCRYFPGAAQVPIERCWSGVLGLTLDRVCSIGVGGRDRNRFHALGYSGHGLALALFAGRVLADRYAGDHDAWRDLPFSDRRLLPFPPEPLRWLGYQAYTRLTGRSPRRQPR